MTGHETHVVTVKNEQHAYCTCGWIDTWRPDDGTAYDSANAHKRRYGMTEQMCTREDMARSWQEARTDGWGEGAETMWQTTGEGWNGEYAGEYSTHDGVAPFREANDDIPNPYEQEEA